MTTIKPNTCPCGGDYEEDRAVLTCGSCGESVVLCDMCEADCHSIFPNKVCEQFIRWG